MSQREKDHFLLLGSFSVCMNKLNEIKIKLKVVYIYTGNICVPWSDMATEKEYFIQVEERPHNFTAQGQLSETSISAVYGNARNVFTTYLSIFLLYRNTVSVAY